MNEDLQNLGGVGRHEHDVREIRGVPDSDDYVDLVSAQTVAGVKTFSDIPVLPNSNPTTDNQAVRKKYADDTFALTGHTHTAYVLYATASNTTQLRYQTAITPGGTYYFRMHIGGKIRLKIYAKETGGQDYYNVSISWAGGTGSAAETHKVIERTSLPSSYDYYNDDIEVRAGDLIKIYAYCSITDVQINFTVNTTTSDFVVAA